MIPMDREINTMINNILVDTKSLLDRKDKSTKEKLMGLWLDFGEKIDGWNEETEKILSTPWWIR